MRLIKSCGHGFLIHHLYGSTRDVNPIFIDHNAPVTQDMPSRPIRTYKLRRTQLSGVLQAAMDKHGEKLVLPPTSEVINLGQSLKLPHFLIEIGFGMGEATVELAKKQPDVAVLALDLHTPGIGKLVYELAENSIDNVRVMEADALEVLEHNIAPDSVDAVRLFFPDPWPKARHHKRRFIVPENLELVASRLKLGGCLHIATDWLDYAENARENLAASPRWKFVESTELCDPAQRPRTKFEQRGIDEKRVITDIVVMKVS
jgi:tRNA (guanine-N7-)-methyltransferase